MDYLGTSTGVPCLCYIQFVLRFNCNDIFEEVQYSAGTILHILYTGFTRYTRPRCEFEACSLQDKACFNNTLKLAQRPFE